MGNGSAEFRKRLERAAEVRSYRGAGITPDGGGRPGAPREESERQKRSKVGDAARADYLVRDAMAQGKFDNLKYAGKPIPGLGEQYDPDWWVKGLLERENISGHGAGGHCAAQLRTPNWTPGSMPSTRNSRSATWSRTSTGGWWTRAGSCRAARRWSP